MTSAPATRSPERDRVAVCSLGGTIQCERAADGSLLPAEGLRADLLRPGVPDGLAVTSHQVHSSPSAALDLAAVLDVLDCAVRQVRDGAVGVVVTTGTDMLDEVAFALDLLWAHREPLVVTGALRAPSVPGADGPANLRDALLVACSASAAGLGCVVVLGGETHTAWQVRKAHTGVPSAFRSPAGGPIGEVTEDLVRMHSRPMDRPQLPHPRRLQHSGPVDIPPVALVTAALGDDGRLLSALPGLGYRGVVLQGSGGGSVPPAWHEPLASLTREIPVVYTSRTGAGAVLQRTYGGPGSERDLLALGAQPGGLLDGVKARILLQLLLAGGADEQTCRSAFTAFDAPTHRAGAPSSP